MTKSEARRLAVLETQVAEILQLVRELYETHFPSAETLADEATRRAIGAATKEEKKS